MTIRLVIAEDNLLVREGIVRLLDRQPDLEILDLCGDYNSLLRSVEKYRPDVVLTDIRMPPTHTDEGIRAAQHFRRAAPDLGVVVLSQYDEAEYALALLENGSRGRAYLLKERVSDPGQLAGAVREVAGGGSVIDPKVVESLVGARLRARTSPLASLTTRESEVLSQMAQGKTNAGIAGALFLSDRAVEKHINALFSKLSLSEELDVHRRVKAVLVYLAETGR
ncbi:MAG: response regulator transcription factor [Actinomycetota bacterium]